MASTRQKPELIQLPKILDRRGNLSFIQEETHIPFEVKRVYMIYDVPGGEIRGGHAFHTQQEILIALSGSFDIVVDNVEEKHRFSMNRSYYGLYIPSGTWRHLENFSTNAVCLVIASTNFDENDYIRDYQTFTTAKY